MITHSRTHSLTRSRARSLTKQSNSECVPPPSAARLIRRRRASLAMIAVLACSESLQVRRPIVRKVACYFQDLAIFPLKPIQKGCSCESLRKCTKSEIRAPAQQRRSFPARSSETRWHSHCPEQYAMSATRIKHVQHFLSCTISLQAAIFSWDSSTDRLKSCARKTTLKKSFWMRMFSKSACMQDCTEAWRS